MSGRRNRRDLVIAVLAVVAGAAPALAQSPPAAGPSNPPLTPPAADAAPDAAPFGEEVTLLPRPALILEGRSDWGGLYPTITGVIRALTGVARAQGAVIAGAPMARFVTSTDDNVTFEAILPVVATGGSADRYSPARVGTTPAGAALKFTHQGGYDTIDQSYDEITTFLDERAITVDDAFVEEYVRDPATTPETDLVTVIYVFRKP